MALLSKIGKALTNNSARMSDGLEAAGKGLLRGTGSKTVLGLLTAGAVVKGLSDTVGQSAIDNAMEVAFDNPEADRAVLGTDLTPSLLLGQAGLGPVSGYARNMNAMQYGIDTGPMPSMALGGLGASAGVMGGIAVGAKVGGVKGSLLGMGAGLLGAATGGTIGAGIGAAPTLGYVNNNRQLLRESPYSNTSMMTAEALNATGDIVFGMHNSRRGY